MEVIKKIATSRKWLSAVVGFILPIVNQKFGWGLSEDTIIQALLALGVIIFGEAYVDGKRAESAASTPKA